MTSASVCSVGLGGAGGSSGNTSFGVSGGVDGISVGVSMGVGVGSDSIVWFRGGSSRGCCILVIGGGLPIRQ